VQLRDSAHYHIIMTERSGQKRHSSTREDNDDDTSKNSDDSSALTGNSTPQPSSPSPSTTTRDQNSTRRSHSTTSSRGSSCELTLEDEVVKKDLSILSVYVKEELYYGVKFLYDPKNDLAVDGVIFNHFYKHCSKRLEGVKSRRTQSEKDLYVRYLWKEATDTRVQQDSLAVKRSSVYTVMQNRFFCK